MEDIEEFGPSFAEDLSITTNELSRKEIKKQEEDLRLWAESKYLEEAVAKKLEKYLQEGLKNLLAERAKEFSREVDRRVRIAFEEIEKSRQIEMQKKRQEEEELLAKKEEEERRLQELQSKTLKQELEQKELERQRQEQLKQQKYQEELRQLEEKQKREAEELKKIKKEQELILNKKHIRPKLSFSLKR